MAPPPDGRKEKPSPGEPEARPPSADARLEADVIALDVTADMVDASFAAAFASASESRPSAPGFHAPATALTPAIRTVIRRPLNCPRIAVRFCSMAALASVAILNSFLKRAFPSASACGGTGEARMWHDHGTGVAREWHGRGTMAREWHDHGTGVALVTAA